MTANCKSQGRGAFTLIELLTVTAIMAILFAIGMNVGTSDKRRTEVEAIARDLAATMRLGRSLAMERRSAYALVFNISNGAGTSGKVINNWGGGHWYQLLGPNEDNSHMGNNGTATYPEAYFDNNDLSIPRHLAMISKAWFGERKSLPARKVRFLALSDQDNGHCHHWNHWDWYHSAFPDTYPRPWFGWYDATTKRLMPWGGYDPTLLDRRGQPCSGFYFQGQDGAISGQRNPANRRSTVKNKADPHLRNMLLLAKDELRPLVNGNWMDSYIAFLPDGTVRLEAFGRARMESRRTRDAGDDSRGGWAVPGYGDLGDLTSDKNWSFIPEWMSAASSWERRSGYWFITVAPDTEQDTDTFASSREALRSITPAIRVGINRFGDVKIVNVRNAMPSGSSILPLPLTSPWSSSPNEVAAWQNKDITYTFYQYNVRTKADGSPEGSPAVDFVTPEQLERRGMWVTP
jgi:prepilin-type N-terminal cleavage/methylation domain-containing protein